MAETTQQHMPRLCRIKKRGIYGFSLLEDGQDSRKQLCQIKSGSPAEEVGLLEGDLLIEVNDVNVEEEELACVLQRIKDSEEVLLLVVDIATDKFYKDQGVKITSKMPEVKHMASKSYFSVANFCVDSDSKPDNGPQQINPYHAGYDQGPANVPQQLNPNHVGYDPPTYVHSVGSPAVSYPMIQQVNLSHQQGTSQFFPQREYPRDLTVCAWCICFCFCWIIGAVGICLAIKSSEYYRRGNFEKGKKYRHGAICVMILTTVVGIALTAVYLILQHTDALRHEPSYK